MLNGLDLDIVMDYEFQLMKFHTEFMIFVACLTLRNIKTRSAFRKIQHFKVIWIIQLYQQHLPIAGNSVMYKNIVLLNLCYYFCMSCFT